MGNSTSGLSLGVVRVEWDTEHSLGVYTDIVSTLRETFEEVDIYEKNSAPQFTVNLVDNNTIGFRVWPGSVRLCRYFLDHCPTLFRGKRVVELGCGLGLPGLFLAKYCGVSEMVLTDREELRPVVAKNVELNDLSGVARFEKFDWSDPVDAKRISQLPSFDFVIASEVIYAEEQEPLVHALAAVAGNAKIFIQYTNRTEADGEYLSDRLGKVVRLVEDTGLGVLVFEKLVN
jgi:predicted nicotinamide N-methyase